MMACIEDPTVDHRKLAFARDHARTGVRAKTAVTTTTMTMEATTSLSSSSSNIQMGFNASAPSTLAKETMATNHLTDSVQLESVNYLPRSDETFKRAVRISGFPSVHLVRSFATLFFAPGVY